MHLPEIDTLRCTGCGWCVAICPPHVLSLHSHLGRKNSVLHDAMRCAGCKKCERRCPFDAIQMVDGGRSDDRLASAPPTR